jgi:hypothetical protein
LAGGGRRARSRGQRADRGRRQGRVRQRLDGL